MNSFRNRKFLLLGILTFCSIPLVSLATDDSISFNFTIYGWGVNGKESAGRYRQTTYVDNPWKVKMTSSSEGKGTITRYWLENASASNVTASVDVKQGLGPYYQSATANANQTDVWLTGENNNFNGNVYKVKGIWDEETW